MTALDEALDQLEEKRPPTAAPAPHAPQPPGKAQLVDVQIEQLFPDPNNPREEVGDDDDLQQLAESMHHEGLIQPIIARRDLATGRLIVVAGHRRLAAAQLLRWGTVPTVIRRDMRPDAILAAMLIENGQRKDLDPIEEARALHRLKHEHGIKFHAELGHRVGRTQNYVSGRLALMALTPVEQEEVRAGHLKIAEATARGRMNAGNVRTLGQTKGWHLDHAHELATQVKARCIRLGHSRGRTVGGIGCGDCWESVIRADERAALTRANVEQGTCPTCGSVDA